jgi:hypothetical protein
MKGDSVARPRHSLWPEKSLNAGDMSAESWALFGDIGKLQPAHLPCRVPKLPTPALTKTALIAGELAVPWRCFRTLTFWNSIAAFLLKV